jgi:hypothetical protein
MIAFLEHCVSEAVPPAAAAAAAAAQDPAPLPAVAVMLEAIGSVCKALAHVRAIHTETQRGVGQAVAAIPSADSPALVALSAASEEPLRNAARLLQAYCVVLADTPEKLLIKSPGGADAVGLCIGSVITALRFAAPDTSVSAAGFIEPTAVLCLHLRLLDAALASSSTSRIKWAIESVTSICVRLREASAHARLLPCVVGADAATELLELVRSWLSDGRILEQHVLHPGAHDDVLAAGSGLIAELCCSPLAASCMTDGIIERCVV